MSRTPAAAAAPNVIGWRDQRSGERRLPRERLLSDTVFSVLITHDESGRSSVGRTRIRKEIITALTSRNSNVS